MKKIMIFMIFCILILSGCTDNSNQTLEIDSDKNDSLQIFEISSSKVDCVGEGPMKCMVVNDKLFYDSIEGFDYEEGYRYTLKVRVEDVKDPLADASSKKYILIDILSKVKG